MVSEDKTANTYLLFLNLFSYYHLFFSQTFLQINSYKSMRMETKLNQ